MSVLARVLARIEGEVKSGHPIAVFDLDSTLFSTQQRNFVILKEFVANATNPTLMPLVDRLGPEDMGWNIMEDLVHHGFTDKETLRELRRFWLARFFQNEYVIHDHPLPGAVDFVCDVYAEGASIFYLTGRDEPNMGRGTRESLRSHGFPLDGERVTLRLKPRFEDSDLEFKRAVLEELHQLGNVVAVFENEPANANLFCDSFPTADILFLETVHSPNPPPLNPKIVRIQDFRR